MKNSKSRIAGKLYGGLKFISIGFTFLSAASLIAVIFYILYNGADKLSLHLLFGDYASEKPTLLPALAGTLQLVLTAVVISVPIGVFSAVFLVEYMGNNGRLVRIIRIATETLAGIPSIVYGLFGYLVFVVAFGWGYCILGGGLTLAVMILPLIVRSSEESLLSVPAGYREGAYALGASKVSVIFRIVLPAASSGIVTSVILAVGRVISESAVLIVTIGMVVNKVPETLLSPGTSLALDIYYFASHGYPDEAAATGVVLLVVVMVLNLSATGVGKLIKRRAGE